MGQLLFRKNLFSQIFVIAVFAAFSFDIAENITQLYLINQLPVVHFSLGTLMGIFTLLKWITILFSLISVIASLIQKGVVKFSTFKQ